MRHQAIEIEHHLDQNIALVQKAQLSIARAQRYVNNIPRCAYCKHLLASERNWIWVKCGFHGRTLYAGPNNNGERVGCAHCDPDPWIHIQTTLPDHQFIRSPLYYIQDCRNCRYCEKTVRTPVPGKESQGPHQVKCHNYTTPRPANTDAPLGANYCGYHAPIPESPYFYKLPMPRDLSRVAQESRRVFMLAQESPAGVRADIAKSWKDNKNVFHTSLKGLNLPGDYLANLNLFFDALFSGTFYLKDEHELIKRTGQIDPSDIWGDYDQNNILAIFDDLRYNNKPIYISAKQLFLRQLFFDDGLEFQNHKSLDCKIKAFRSEKPTEFYRTAENRSVLCTPSDVESWLSPIELPPSGDQLNSGEIEEFCSTAYCSPLNIQAISIEKKLDLIQFTESEMKLLKLYMNSSLRELASKFGRFTSQDPAIPSFYQAISQWHQENAAAKPPLAPDEVQEMLQFLLLTGAFYSKKEQASSASLAKIIEAKLFEDGGTEYQTFLATFQDLGNRGLFAEFEAIETQQKQKESELKTLTKDLNAEKKKVAQKKKEKAEQDAAKRLEQSDQDETQPQEEDISEEQSLIDQLEQNFAENKKNVEKLTKSIEDLKKNTIEKTKILTDLIEKYKKGDKIEYLGQDISKTFAKDRIAPLIAKIGGRLSYFKPYLEKGEIPAGIKDLCLFYLEIQFIIGEMFPEVQRERLSAPSIIDNILNLLYPEEYAKINIPEPNTFRKYFEGIIASKSPQGDPSTQFSPLSSQIKNLEPFFIKEWGKKQVIDDFGGFPQFFQFIETYERAELGLYHFAYCHSLYLSQSYIVSRIVCPVLYSVSNGTFTPSLEIAKGYPTGTKCKIAVFPREMVASAMKTTNPRVEIYSQHDKIPSSVRKNNGLTESVNNAIDQVFSQIAAQKELSENPASRKYAIHSLIRIFKRMVAANALSSSQNMKSVLKAIKKEVQPTEKDSKKLKEDIEKALKKQGALSSETKDTLQTQFMTAMNNANKIKTDAIEKYISFTAIDPLIAPYFACRFDISPSSPIVALYLDNESALLGNYKGRDIAVSMNRDIKPVRNWLDKYDTQIKEQLSPTNLTKLLTDLASALKKTINSDASKIPKSTLNALNYLKRNALFGLMHNPTVPNPYIEPLVFEKWWGQYGPLFPKFEIEESGQGMKDAFKTIYDTYTALDPKKAQKKEDQKKITDTLAALAKFPALTLDKKTKLSKDFATACKTIYDNIINKITSMKLVDKIDAIKADVDAATINKIKESITSAALPIDKPKSSKTWLNDFIKNCTAAIAHFRSKEESDDTKKSIAEWSRILRLGDLFKSLIRIGQIYSCASNSGTFTKYLMPVLNSRLFPSQGLIAALSKSEKKRPSILNVNMNEYRKTEGKQIAFNVYFKNYQEEISAIWALAATGIALKNQNLSIISNKLLDLLKNISPPVMRRPRAPQSPLGRGSYYGKGLSRQMVGDIKKRQTVGCYLPISPNTDYPLDKFVLRDPNYIAKSATPSVNNTQSDKWDKLIEKLFEKLDEKRTSIQKLEAINSADGVFSAHKDLVQAALKLYFKRTFNEKMKIAESELSESEGDSTSPAPPSDAETGKKEQHAVGEILKSSTFTKSKEWLTSKGKLAVDSDFFKEFTAKKAKEWKITAVKSEFDEKKEEYEERLKQVRSLSSDIKKISRSIAYYNRHKSRAPKPEKTAVTEREQIWGIVKGALKPCLQKIPQETFIKAFFDLPKKMKQQITDSKEKGLLKVSTAAIVGIEYPSLNLIGNISIMTEKSSVYATTEFQDTLKSITDMPKIKKLASDINRAICNHELKFGGLDENEEPVDLRTAVFPITDFDAKANKKPTDWERLVMYIIGSDHPHQRIAADFEKTQEPPSEDLPKESKNVAPGDAKSKKPPESPNPLKKTLIPSAAPTFAPNLLQKIEDSYFTSGSLSRPSINNRFGGGKTTTIDYPHNIYDEKYNAAENVCEALSNTLYWFTVKRMHIQEHTRILLKILQKTDDGPKKTRLRSELYHLQRKYDNLRDLKHEIMTRQIACIAILTKSESFAIEHLSFGKTQGVMSKIVKGMVKHVNILLPRANWILKQIGKPPIATIEINPQFTSKYCYSNLKLLGLREGERSDGESAIIESLASVVDKASSDWGVVPNMDGDSAGSPYRIVNRHTQATANMAWKAIQKQTKKEKAP